jgi:HEAT repeat protein
MFRGHFDTEMAYKMVFFVTAGIRVVAMLFLMPVKEEGSAGFRATLRTFRSFTPKGVRAMRSLQSSTDEQSRVGAIQDVGTSRASMATEDVIKALHDPLPRVRRRAAAALANLKDPRAVEALLHMLEEHPDLVEEETVEALGLLGNRQASQALMGLLHHPSAMIRRAAARALARLDAQDAIPVLIQCVAESEDIDLRRAALQALRVLHASAAGPAVAAAMMDTHPSVRVAAAEAVSEIGLADAADAVRQSLRTFTDEASSEGVYALGVVGERSDLPLILQKAQECASMITRRRCLLAAARILEVEREAYRLMLLEGIARDEALIQLSQRTAKPAVARAALARYSAGDEAGALEELAKIDPAVAVLAETPVEESFLVALATLTRK